MTSENPVSQIVTKYSILLLASKHNTCVIFGWATSSYNTFSVTTLHLQFHVNNINNNPPSLI